MARLMLGLEPCRDFQVVCPENVTYYDKTAARLAQKTGTGVLIQLLSCELQTRSIR